MHFCFAPEQESVSERLKLFVKKSKKNTNGDYFHTKKYKEKQQENHKNRVENS